MPKKTEKETKKEEESQEQEDTEEQSSEDQADDGSDNEESGEESGEKSDEESGEKSDDDEEDAEESEEDPDEDAEEEPKKSRSKSAKTSKTSKTSKSKKSKKAEPVDDDLFEEVKITPKDIQTIIGEFPEIQRNNQASAEAGYILKAATLFYFDAKQAEMTKQQIGPHIMRNIKSNSGMPALSKTATQFETLRDFTGGRGKVQSGSQKLFNPNNRPVLLCLETFLTMIMNELTKNLEVKTGEKLYERLKKDRHSMLGAILRYANSNPKCDMVDDYGSGEKIDEIFENYIPDKEIRAYVVNALVRYLKFLGSAFATSLSINKRAITFRTVLEMILITLKTCGYTMTPKTELAFMLYAEHRARSIIKKAKEAKLLSGKTKTGKGGVGKKMTERERAKNVKDAKTKKTTKTTKTTRTAKPKTPAKKSTRAK